MRTPGKPSEQQEIRLSRTLSLIFFACLFAAACRQQGSERIAVVWKDSIPEAVAIPLTLLNKGAKNVSPDLIRVRLQHNVTDVLGELQSANEEIVFRPLLPFTAGMKYEVLLHEQVIGLFSIPEKKPSAPPVLTAIYPSADTLPSNLLKFYFKFSAAMREGEALQHIHLVDEQADTIPGVFLQVQPELWNADRTELTVWIDPGRIKRELIPNKKMGNPLVPGRRYTLYVSGTWKNIHGIPLHRSVHKQFVVGARDSLSPDPGRWSILAPKAKTTQAAKFIFPEPFDYFLIRETVTILDEKGKTITGELRVTGNETGFEFIPSLPWKPGPYRVRVDARLEDLAGNNLNRPFDRDITIPRTSLVQEYFEKTFMIAL